MATISQAQENILQIDQGKNYTQSVFLDLATKEVTTIDFTTWDIAFATGARDVSVLINEAVKGGEAGRSLHLFSTSSNDFSETDMTQIKDTLFNGDAALSDGAFNTVKDTANAFDFGWGLYNPSTHIVSGTQIFIIQLRNGDYKKIRIDKYDTQKYTFIYADSLSKAQDAIGYEWKYFDRNTFQYTILDDLAYFVKTPNNEVYKIQFLDFEGASTGVTTIKATLEEVLSSLTTPPEYIKSTQVFQILLQEDR